eukprot:7836-Heterococcus_DN1.PRE.4
MDNSSRVNAQIQPSSTSKIHQWHSGATRQLNECAVLPTGMYMCTSICAPPMRPDARVCWNALMRNGHDIFTMHCTVYPKRVVSV